MKEDVKKSFDIGPRWERFAILNQRLVIDLGLGTRDGFRRGCLLLQGILLGLVWFLPLR
jgi:hypothetical protein